MDWNIVYKGKAIRGTLKENLEKAGITYFIPKQRTEHLEGDRMVEHEETILNNLIFIETTGDINETIRSIDGLRAPYIDCSMHKPAIVSDDEMQRFRKVLEMLSVKAQFLPDAYKKFESCPKVRVKAGDFEGMEGRVLRIRGDRKLVINIGDMAVAVSGIHHTLLEIIE